MRGTVLGWCCSFLESKFQKVLLEEDCSTPWCFSYGVPQGSIFSPVLFNMYETCGWGCWEVWLKCHQNAGDTKIYFNLSPHFKGAVDPLSQCLEAVMSLMRISKPRLNPDKKEVLSMEDVVSLLTCIPVSDALKLLEPHFSRNLVQLFHHVLSSTCFLFNGKYYDPLEGVAMGSPLSPVVADLFMENFEQQVLLKP